MAELQAGMLCLVVGYTHDPQFVGSSVTLIELVPPEGVFDIPGSLRQGLSGEPHENWVVDVGGTGWSFIQPKHLLPIEPPEEMAGEKAESKKPCVR